jgi:hypothetical protein
MPTNGPNRLDAMAAQSECDDVFMALLAKTEAEGRPVAESKMARNSAPTIFGKHPDRRGFTSREFEAAMHRLFAAGRIRMTEYGRGSGRGKPSKIVRVEDSKDA